MWYVLASARHADGQVAAARKDAQRALATADRPMEREQAEALLEQLRDGLTLPAPAPPKPPVTVPDAWNQPKGAASIEGELRELVCSQGANGRLRVYSSSGLHEFLLTPQTRSTGRETELRCGPRNPPVSVAITYDPASREAVSIAFR